MRAVLRIRRRRVEADIDLTMINRPHFMLDPERKWFAISWGNGYSDPVISIQINLR